MKAAQIQQYGGDDVVNIRTDISMPSTLEDKVLLKIHAAGVNPVDWKIRAGLLQQMMPITFPFTLGFDVSGTVVNVGDRVSDIRIGDEVYGSAGVLTGGSGTFAEFALADTRALAPKPNDISHTESAALPVAGVSAVQALVESMHLQKNQSILIHGGAGGIGSFAIQLAKHLGAHVITTVRAEDTSYVTGLGADEVIDYTKQSFDATLHDLDAVLDTIGGDTYERSFPILKKGGVLVSMLQRPDEKLFGKHYGVREFSQSTKVTHHRLTTLADFVNQKALVVHVEKTFTLDQAAEALTYLETAHPRGKVVIKIV